MKVFVALALIVASTSATEWWTPPSGPVCVSDWWPYTCAMHMGNESSVCVGYERYDSMEACAGTQGEEYPGPEGPVCVTSWWPYTCAMHMDNETVCVGWDRYDSIEACGGSTEAPADGYCVVSWWDPFACEQISEGNCIGWYPTGGYETEDECLGNHEEEAEEECTFNCGDYCVTSWWPYTCGNGSATEGGCAGWTRYEDVADCCPESNPNCAGEEVAASPGPLGYCVESWWPFSCVPIASGDCLPNTWYPGAEYLGDGRGWATEAECLGETEKSGFKHHVNVHKQIDALKTMEVLKLNAAWAKETARRAQK